MKKFFIIFVTILLAFSMLFGCGKNSDKNVDATEAPVSEPTQEPDVEPSAPAAKFAYHIKDLLPENTATKEEFTEKYAFAKGYDIEISGLALFGAEMKVNVGLDKANEALDLTVTLASDDMSMEFLKMIYKDGLYVSEDGNWVKTDAETYLGSLIGYAPFAELEDEDFLDEDVLDEDAALDENAGTDANGKSLADIADALESYVGDFETDLMNILAAKLTWTEDKNEIICTLTSENIAAAKSAIIDLLTSNEGLKDKLTADDMESALSSVFESLEAFAGEDSSNMNGVTTISMITENGLASSIKINNLSSGGNADDENSTDFSEFDLTFTKTSDGFDFAMTSSSWTTDGSGAVVAADSLGGAASADAADSLGGDATGVTETEMSGKIVFGDDSIVISFSIPETEDSEALNLTITIKALDREIVAPV